MLTGIGLGNKTLLFSYDLSLEDFKWLSNAHHHSLCNKVLWPAYQGNQASNSRGTGGTCVRLCQINFQTECLQSS